MLDSTAKRWPDKLGVAGLCASIAAAILLHPPAARSDPLSVINALRVAGCDDQPGLGTPIQPEPMLDKVAEELSRYYELEEAFDRTAYPVASSSSFHLRGSREDAAIRSMLAGRFCETINDPLYEEVGVFAKGDETWIVLAVRQASPPRLDPFATRGRVLDLVNAARAERRMCGDAPYGPAEPLRLSTLLSEAASAHARDMAMRGYAGHDGSDGSRAGERISRTGYVWQAYGENVAAGQQDADAVVAAWLGSPDHCAGLMEANFTETGIAFALAPAQNPDIYWTQVFATPRSPPTPE